MAYIVPERVAGHGDHICFSIERKYPIARIFKGRKGTGLEVHTGNRIGLVDDVASVLKEEMLDIHSERTVHQLKMVKKIQLKTRERSEARAGHHDDDLSSLWCVVQGWRFYPRGLDPIEKHQHLVKRRAGRMKQIVEQEQGNPDPGGFY